MGGFTVDCCSVERFAKLIGRYADDADSVRQYILDNTDADSKVSTFTSPWTWAKDLVDPVYEEGIFAALLGKHQEYWKKAFDRSNTLNQAGVICGTAVSDAAHYYRNTDKHNAERLDAAYPDAKVTDLPPWDSGDQGTAVRKSAEQFRDVAHPKTALKKPDGSDLQPKSDAIQSWVDKLANGVSIAYWWRELWKAIEYIAGHYLHLPSFNTDPISYVVQMFTGDWKLWAYYADVWRNCGQAVNEMEVNVFYGTKALTEFWQGHAGDSAAAFFVRFAKATGGEELFFDYLFNVYKAYLDIVYDYFQDIGNLVNTLIDEATTGPLGEIAHAPQQVKTIASTAQQIYDKVTEIISIVSQGGDFRQNQFGEGTGAVENIYALATAQEPPSTMGKFLDQVNPHLVP